MANRTMEEPVVERRWDGGPEGAVIYHVEVKQGDKVWIHRTWGWTVEEYELTKNGFERVGEFLDPQTAPDVIVTYLNQGHFPTLEELDSADPDVTGKAVSNIDLTDKIL